MVENEGSLTEVFLDQSKTIPVGAHTDASANKSSYSQKS